MANNSKPIYLRFETFAGRQAAAIRAQVGDAVVAAAEAGDRVARAKVRTAAAMNAPSLSESEREEVRAAIFGGAPPDHPASPAPEPSDAEQRRRGKRRRPSAAALASLRDHVERAWAAKRSEGASVFDPGPQRGKRGPSDGLCRLAAMLIEVHEGDAESAAGEWNEVARERALRRNARRLAQMAAQFWYSTENPEAWRAGIERLRLWTEGSAKSLRAVRDALRATRAG